MRCSLGKMYGALFSDCERYRYLLWRRWGADSLTAKWCNFIMLNPSTADEMRNDPTVARCEKRARDWGFDGLYVTNIFAWRSTNPYDLRRVDDPIGPENNTCIIETAALSKLVVCAWGNHGKLGNRSDAIRLLLAAIPTHALKMSENTGEPYHPLYLSYSLKPISMDARADAR